MGLRLRPKESKELVNEAEMGSNLHCVVLHACLSNLVVHDLPCVDVDQCGVSHHE